VIATALHRGELVLRDDVPDLGGPPIDLSGDVFMGLVEVPNGLDPGHAAMTEPMAVGLHAVNRAAMAPGEGALVLGCGPVGLAVFAALADPEEHCKILVVP